MTLIELGLLLGMVGLVWVMVIAIRQADHQTKRESPRAQDKPLAEAAHCESKAAGRVSVRQARQNEFLYGSRAVNNQETL